MAISILFTPPSMSEEQYNEIIRRLEAAGAGSPPGRRHHVCFGASNQLRVMDVWDSQSAFDAFAGTLMPVLQQVGIDPGQPEIREVHNVIEGGAGPLDLTGVRIGDRAAANLALVRRIYQEIDNGNLGIMDELYAPDCRIQITGTPQPLDRESFKQFAAGFYAGFPDLVHHVEDQVAAGDRVVTRLTARGTQQGEFQGIPATGRRISADAVSIFRLVDGRIVEGWIVADLLALLQQLGAIPTPEQTAV